MVQRGPIPGGQEQAGALSARGEAASDPEPRRSGTFSARITGRGAAQASSGSAVRLRDGP